MFRKLNFYSILLFGLLIINCNSVKEAVQKEVIPLSPLDMIVGVWEGSYSGANQGETALTLDIYKENDKYIAIFHYYNLPGKNNVREGKYYMDVSYNETTESFYFKASDWIIHPANYSRGDLEGSLNGDLFSGSLIASNSKNIIKFNVVRLKS